MAHRVTLMAGLHATPGTLVPWEGQAIDLAANLKSVGCRHFKIRQNLDGFSDEASIHFLKNTIVSGEEVMYDAKVKQDRDTADQYISRLIDYGVTHVTVWIDESGLPEIESLVQKRPKLLPHLCGVIELTTTPKEQTWRVHWCGREMFMAQQAIAAAKFGMRNFVCAIPDAQALRNAVKEAVPEATIRLYCPGIRLKDEPPGRQIHIGTPQEAIDAGVDVVISEGYIANATDPRYAYTGLREQLK